MSTKFSLALTMALALAACDGGGSGDSTPASGCVGSFLGGTVTNNVTECTGSCSSPTTPTHAIDGQRNTYAEFSSTSGSRTLSARTQSGIVFPAGNFAGALMVIPTEYFPGSSWTINTYLNGVPQESRTPANTSGGDPNNPSGADDYYGLTTSLAFDQVEFVLNGGTAGLNPPEVRVYEFCSQR